MKLKLTIGQALSQQFSEAFAKLCGDTSISIKDRYAVGRVDRDIVQASSDYETQRAKIIREVGEPLLPMLKRQYEISKMPAQATALEKRIAELEASPGKGEQDFGIDRDNKEQFGKYVAKVNELLAVEFDIFLDHKIAVGDESKLTANDLNALDAIVEVK
jgi:hypothetical protein